MLIITVGSNATGNPIMSLGLLTWTIWIFEATVPSLALSVRNLTLDNLFNSKFLFRFPSNVEPQFHFETKTLNFLVACEIISRASFIAKSLIS